MLDSAALTADLRLIACFAGYLSSGLFVILLIVRFRAFLWGERTRRPSWLTLLFFAALTAALVLHCYWDITFQPSPARW